MMLFILISLCAALAVEAKSVGDVANSTQQQDTEDKRVFYIRQRTSKLIVHTEGNKYSHLYIEGKIATTRDHLWYFVPDDRFGHFGYIRHWSTDREISTETHDETPGDNYDLEVWDEKGLYKSLFAYDEAYERFVHIEGKIWRPYQVPANPTHKDLVVYTNEKLDAERFVPYHESENTVMSIYPDPDVSGTWEMVVAYIEPSATYTYTVTQKIGKVQSESQTTHNGWSFSAGFAKKMFSAGASTSGFMEYTDEKTWYAEYEETVAVTVPAGETVVVWQYLYKMTQYNEQYLFKSNIIADTRSTSEKPDLNRYAKRRGCLGGFEN